LQFKSRDYSKQEEQTFVYPIIIIIIIVYCAKRRQYTIKNTVKIYTQKNIKHTLYAKMLKLISHQYRMQWHCKRLPYCHFSRHVIWPDIIFKTNCNKRRPTTFQCWQSFQCHIIRIVSFLREKESSLVK